MTRLLWGIVGCWMVLGTLSAGAADKPPATPGEEAIARATKLVKQTYRDDYAALRTPAQRAALGARLFREGLETQDDAAARYVLLCEARDLASRGGDAAIACKAIEQLVQQYGVAPGEMVITAISAASRTAITPAAHEAAARCAVEWADNSVRTDDYDLATRLMALGETAAAKAHKVSLTVSVQEKSKEITWAAAEYEQAKPALNAAGNDAATPAVRGAAGRFRCLVKGDFEAGLPLLLEGSDGAWHDLAQKDAAALSGDSAAQAEVGNLWWDTGDKLPSRARSHCRARAAWWYGKAMAGLSGITRTTIQKRLEEVELARLRELRIEPGLVATFFGTENFEKPMLSRLDEQIDFEWPGAPADGLPKDNFSVRWTGRLRVTAAGKHALTVLANEGARVFIDGQLVLDLPDGTRKRAGKKASIVLAEGMHDLKVEFWDAGGLARVRLLWAPPGATGEAPIPAAAFFHDRTAEK